MPVPASINSISARDTSSKTSAFILIAALLIGLGCSWAGASVYKTQQQALQTAFASSQVDRRTLFLSVAQIKQIEERARVKVTSSILSYYVSRNAEGNIRFAFFDQRIVRSMPVTYMTVLKPDGTVDYVDILSFDEPNDYLPPARWLKLYHDRALNNDLAIGQAIPHITGASLSSQAMNDGIRLILATYQVAVQAPSPS
jgi:hypothetical protein